jgi:recombination protein RecT
MAETKSTAVAPAKKAALTFEDLLERMKPRLEAILPKHLTAERMVALASLAATKTPKLRECQPLSLFNAIMNASRLGLEIGQYAHLVPFRNNKLNITECVMIPDYRGLISLAVRSEKVVHIDARVVYDGDAFAYVLGSSPRIDHAPKIGTPRGDEHVIGFYAVAHLATGMTVFDEPMTKAEVDAVRGRSRAKDDGPWVTDYQAMGKKTVVKRLAKFLPQTPEMAAAVELDNRAETGEVGTVSDIIDSAESVNQAVAQSTKEKAEALKERLTEKAEPSDAKEPAEAKATAKDGSLPW